jgi:hypothetical protein
MQSLFLIISRNRPDYLERTINGIYDNTACKPYVFVGIDTDEPRRAEYLALACQYPIELVVLPERKAGEELYLSRLYNQLYAEVLRRVSNFDLVMPFADDINITTPNWDSILGLRKPDDDLYIAWPFDGFMFACTIPMLSKRIVDLVGFVGPEELHHWYCDTWWGELARITSRALPLPEVCFEHLSPLNPATKAISPDDDAYQYSMRNNGEEIKQDKAEFLSQENLMRRVEYAQRIRKEILEYQRRKNDQNDRE